MRLYLTIFFCLEFFSNSFSQGCSAAPDTRPLPQLFYKENRFIVFCCKVKSNEVAADGNAYSIAEITEVLYGKTTLKEAKILSGHFNPPQPPLLLKPQPQPVKKSNFNVPNIYDGEIIIDSYSGGSINWGIKMQIDSSYIIYNDTVFSQAYSSILYFGRSKPLKNTPAIANEVATIKLFGTILNEHKTGRYTFKDEKGKILAEGSYKKGKLSGIWKQYNENGVLVSVENFKDKLYQKFYLNGNLETMVSEYKDSTITENFADLQNIQLSSKTVSVKVDSFLHLYITEYDKEGHLYSKHEEFKNRYIGLYYEYYPTGKIKTISEYNLHPENYRNGIYQQYYPNGQLKLDAHIINARRVGCWIWYYEDGTFWTEWDYLDGKAPQ